MLDENLGKSVCILGFDLYLEFLFNKCLLLKIVTFSLGGEFEKRPMVEFPKLLDV